MLIFTLLFFLLTSIPNLIPSQLASIQENNNDENKSDSSSTPLQEDNLHENFESILKKCLNTLSLMVNNLSLMVNNLSLEADQQNNFQHMLGQQNNNMYNLPQKMLVPHIANLESKDQYIFFCPEKMLEHIKNKITERSFGLSIIEFESAVQNVMKKMHTAYLQETIPNIRITIKDIYYKFLSQTMQSYMAQFNYFLVKYTNKNKIVTKTSMYSLFPLEYLAAVASLAALLISFRTYDKKIGIVYNTNNENNNSHKQSILVDNKHNPTKNTIKNLIFVWYLHPFPTFCINDHDNRKFLDNFKARYNKFFSGALIQYSLARYAVFNKSIETIINLLKNTTINNKNIFSLDHASFLRKSYKDKIKNQKINELCLTEEGRKVYEQYYNAIERW